MLNPSWGFQIMWSLLLPRSVPNLPQPVASQPSLNPPPLDHPPPNLPWPPEVGLLLATARTGLTNFCVIYSKPSAVGVAQAMVAHAMQLKIARLHCGG